MATLNEQIAKDKEDWDRLKRLQKLNARNERLDKDKEDNHRIFLLGKLAVETIPALSGIQVFKGKGATAKNNASLMPFKKALSELVANEELMAQLGTEINRNKYLEK